MTFHIYTNYNRKVEAYERPLVRLEDPDEYIETVCRDFKGSDLKAQAKIVEYDIIYQGQYDDVTGKFLLCEPNLIFSCASLALPKEEKTKEEKINA